jgi:hypothetical protein
LPSGLAERAVYRHRPHVAVVHLPDHQHEARARPHRSRDVAKCHARVVEEHGAKATDRDVELAGLERVVLNVAQLEASIRRALEGP